MLGHLLRHEGSVTKLLVIEDEPIVLEMLSHSLGVSGYELITAVDGEDGLAKTIEHEPDLIITDMSLPKITGWDLIKKIREHKNSSQTPIIALTAHATSEDRVAAYEAGVSAYESKPLDIKKLLARIETLIG